MSPVLTHLLFVCVFLGQRVHHQHINITVSRVYCTDSKENRNDKIIVSEKISWVKRNPEKKRDRAKKKEIELPIKRTSIFQSFDIFCVRAQSSVSVELCRLLSCRMFARSIVAFVYHCDFYGCSPSSLVRYCH